MNRSFVRKVYYLIAIALLLVPMSWLSQPETTGGKNVKASSRRAIGPAAQAPRAQSGQPG